MKDNIRFWVAVGTVRQLDFEGRAHSVDVPVGEAHIIYSEVLMCRQSRDTLKGKLNAKKQRTVTSRPTNVKLCERCEKKYKENPDLSWAKWLVSPEPKFTRVISIKPELVQK